MKNIENAILSFKNWSHPWTFKESILKNTELNAVDVKVFDEIWAKTSGPEFWRDLDLVLSCKASQSYIRDNYDLSEEVIAKIVRALSYGYR